MSTAWKHKRMVRYWCTATVFVAGCTVGLPGLAIGDGAQLAGAQSHGSPLSLEATVAAASPLPPALPGVTDLAFRDFYRIPVGRYGLEPTEKLLSLDGKQVRILGYMVWRERPVPGTFILAPFPVTMAEEADGEADDLPPAIVFVRMPDDAAHLEINSQRGLFLLTGVLSLGPREEADGRMSFVRLQLASPPSGERAATPAPQTPARAGPSAQLSPAR